MEIMDTFKTPVFTSKLSLDIVPLINKIHKLKDKNPIGRKRSNEGGWQSEPIKNLSKNLIKELNKNVSFFAKKIGLKTPLKLTHLWANINNYNDYNVSHIHPGSQLSGVFYLKVPKNSGNIVFVNPVGNSLLYNWNGNHITSYNNYTSYKFTYDSETLRLFLFPGWLNHYVERSQNEKEERISISFNYEYI